MTLITGARVVTPGSVLDTGWLEIVDGHIVSVGAGPAPDAVPVEQVSGWLLPGFVDLHVHGGGGHDFTASAEDIAAGVAFHRSHGTTRTLVSLMAAPIDVLGAQLGWVAELTASGVVTGAHLEGPFLAAARCGAQNPDHLLAPEPAMLRKLLDAGQGAVRTITIAPEVPGALALIEQTAAAGVVAAIGHTNASYEQAHAGFDAGATLATHLFNAMGSFHQRAPGPAIAALDAGVDVEIINDGTHVHDALVRHAARFAPDRVSFITDAISATGVGDGHYTLGDRDVLVDGGRAHLAGSDRLAGSTLTMDKAVRRAVHDVGLPIEVAAAAAATNPARVLGLSDRCGAIAAGLDADLVLLDDNLRVQRVMLRGRWLAPTA